MENLRYRSDKSTRFKPDDWGGNIQLRYVLLRMPDGTKRIFPYLGKLLLWGDSLGFCAPPPGRRPGGFYFGCSRLACQRTNGLRKKKLPDWGF